MSKLDNPIDADKSTRMRHTIHYALHLTAHDFGLLDNFGHQFNESRSPKLAESGVYYLPCTRCGLCVFEDGTGSATDNTCKYAG